MAQETCVGDQCTVPGSVYRPITDLAVSGTVKEKGLRLEQVHPANNAALSAISTASASVVVRNGFLTSGDSPPLMFARSTAKCTLIASVFTASVAGNILNVTSVTSGSVLIGLPISANGLTAGTVITAYAPGQSGSAGGTGSYVLSNSFSFPSQKISQLGDGAAQVPSADGNCWNAIFSYPLDARWWGKTYPLVLSATSAGNDYGGANLCVALACLTQQQGVLAAAKFNWQNQDAFLNLSSGTFAGAMISGVNSGTSGNGISGQYLRIVGGVGGGTTTVTAHPGDIFNYGLSNGARVVLSNITCSIAASNYCYFAQNPGTTLNVFNLTCNAAASSSTCGHGEAFALNELNATTTLKAQGTFGAAFAFGGQGYMEFDPGGTGVFDCGTGLTATQVFFVSDLSTLFYGSGWSTANCSGATGVPAAAFNNATINNGGGNLPGNGSYSIQDNSSFFPAPIPTLGTCTNGALVNAPSNYTMRVAFSGANSNCAIVFGKPSNVTSWFSNTPTCMPIAGHASGLALAINNFDNTGFNIASAGFVNGDFLDVKCTPSRGG